MLSLLVDYMFPGGANPDAAFANTAMETFFQKEASLSCMGCHGQVSGTTDRVWSLSIERPSTHASAVDLLKLTLSNAGIAIQ